MAIPRHRPALEARRTEPSEVGYAALDEWLDLEVFLPERPIPQMLRQTSEEQIGRLHDVPVGRDDKVLFGHSMRPSCAGLARAGGRAQEVYPNRSGRTCATFRREIRPTGRYKTPS